MTEDEIRSAAPDDLNHLLVAVGQARDRQAFATLFTHFAPRLKAFVLRAGTDPNMAEEIVQESMVKLWRKAVQFDPDKASATTWVYTIARNMRIDMLRKARRPEPYMDDPALVPDSEPHALDALSDARDAARLRAAVASLPADQKEVLTLAFFQEKSHATVAEELGIPLGTVKSRIRLAFKRVRADLGEIE